MKKTSILIVIALTLATGTGIGFLVASPKKDSLPTTTQETNAPVAQVSQQESVTDPELPLSQVNWSATNHSFGEIPQGKPVKYRYEFTNTGKADLQILGAKPACGCTSSEYTKDPVKPGQKGFVEAVFNAAAEGIFKKSVTVTMNTDPKITVLNFEGTVIK